MAASMVRDWSSSYIHLLAFMQNLVGSSQDPQITELYANALGFKIRQELC